MRTPRGRRGRRGRKAARTPRPPTADLKRAIQQRLSDGSCAYCGMPARPECPLTREHVIPRSRGGGRREWGVIVPACTDCNRRRGARPLPLFLLAFPRRLGRVLAYFAALPPEAIRQVDARVFAELLATLLLREQVAVTTRDETLVGPALERAHLKCLHQARRVLARLRVRLSNGEGVSLASSQPPAPFPGRNLLPALAALLAIAWDASPVAVAVELREVVRARARKGLRFHALPAGAQEDEVGVRGRRAVA